MGLFDIFKKNKRQDFSKNEDKFIIDEKEKVSFYGESLEENMKVLDKNKEDSMEYNESYSGVLIDNDMLKVTCNGIKYYNDQIVLKILLENKTNKDIKVQSRKVSVNGRMTEPILSAGVVAKKEAKDEITFDEDIKTLINFEGIISVIDWDSYDDIAEFSFFAFKNQVKNNDNDLEGETVIDTDTIKVSCIGITRDDDELNLNLLIKNKIDKDIIVQSRKVSVDGMMTDPTFSCTIVGGKKAYDNMTFENDIQDLINVEGIFCVMESDTYEDIAEYKFSMLETDETVDTGEVEGIVIIDNDIVRVSAMTIEHNEENETILNLLIYNKSDKDIIAQTRKVSVDGMMTDPTFSCTIVGGKKAYDNMTFENDIQDLINVEGIFCVMESDTYEDIAEYKFSMLETDETVDKGEVEGLVIVDNNIIQVSATTIEYSEYNETMLNLLVHNKTNIDLNIQLDRVAINGMMAYPLFSCEVLSGKMAKARIVFDEYIKEISTVSGRFEIMEYESWETIENCNFEIESN